MDDKFIPQGQSRDEIRANMMRSSQLSAMPGANSQSGNDTRLSDLVYVYVYLNGSTNTSIVDAYAWNVTDRDENIHIAVAWVELKNLEMLASLDGVRSISTVDQPEVRMGSTTTEGDAILHSSDLRAKLGATGKGIKIGVISDGVDGLDSSVALGDLPSNVTVLGNNYNGVVGYRSEGTAMLEIIYDMAPDAQLYFHDMGNNTLEFNNAIDSLAAAGCNVIVDDIGWYNEPYFEDGTVASHINSVISGHNIIYITSAGNDAARHYQGTYYGYPVTMADYSTRYFHDFSSGSSSYKFLYVNVPAYQSMSVFLEWNDKFGSSSNDYDLYLYDESGYMVAYSVNLQTGTQNPYERVSFTNYYSYPQIIRVGVQNYQNAASPRTLELFIWGDTYSNNIKPADSIFGHAAVPGVISVGALGASSPTSIEPYSSQGPATISYPSSQVRQKTDISGIDGVSVTGSGGFYNPFYGTSAAAPHVAAIAAQLWSLYPTKSNTEIKNLIYNSAVDLGTPGYDNVYGNGRADTWNAAVSGAAPCSYVQTNTIPSTMDVGKSYNVSITMKNTGNIPWTYANSIRLGGVGDSSGDAFAFGNTRFDLAPDAVVKPNQFYTWNFTLTAPSTIGTYHPKYQMLWEGYQWFGPMANNTISVIYMPNSTLIASNVSSSMIAGCSYPVSITMNNTGDMPWSSSNGVSLGAVGDSSGDAVKFAPARIGIDQGVNVLPGQNYTWNFTVIAPASGTYHPKYQLVWEGHQWFGETANNTIVSMWPGATVLNNTIPNKMVAGNSYIVSVTMKNTGNMPWPAGDMGLGGVGNASGDASRFGDVRYDMEPGTIVQPNQSYNWSFTMAAPGAAGTYRPSYQMVWEDDKWFGTALNATVNVVPIAPNATVVSDNIPGAMTSGQSYQCSVTVKNTGTKMWNSSDSIGLGAVNDAAGPAGKFGATRFYLPSNATVNPGDQYTFNFTLTAPAAGTYYPAWQMVWEGHQWFGQTLCKTVIVAPSLTPDAAIVSYSIPGSMTSGQSYSCTMTVRNTGTKPWSSSDPIRLGALYDSAGAAGKFGATRFTLPTGVTVNPGDTYTFNMALTAPAAGTYYPAWQMVWEGHQWFGKVLCITVTVSPAASTPDAAIVSYNIPGSMSSGQSYACNVTVRNTGTKAWNSTDAIGLGALYDSAGAAGKFGATRFYVPSGVTVCSGSQYTFNFTLTAPAVGTYYPAWQMVWEGHQWFGQQLVITENVS